MAESLFIDKSLPKEEKYKTVLDQINFLFDPDDHIITSLSNFTALLKQSFDTFSWVGFYLLKNNFLYLGPFQGKLACSRIEAGKGVCGTSVLLKKSIIVPDVNQFPGHIACDSDSKSEIVIPLDNGQQLFGVLDIDSTFYNNFDEIDKLYLEKLCNLFLQKLNFSNFILT
jgi:GAF domain-containing protein